jgi:hypothetical protein
MPRQLRSPITRTLAYFVSEIRSFRRNAVTFEVGVAEMPLRLRSSSYVLSGGKISWIQIWSMGCQRAHPNNRVIDVLWKFIPDFGANFVLGFAFVTIRRNEAYEVKHRFNVPYEHVWHVMRLAYIAAYTDSLCGWYGFFMRRIGLRSDVEKSCFLDSHLSESPRIVLQYFCNILALLEATAGE